MKYKIKKPKQTNLANRLKAYEATAKQEEFPVTPYDYKDILQYMDTSKPLKFEDIGIKLPQRSFTEVVSLRLPTNLVNDIRMLGSEHDIPYQALIKLFLAESVVAYKKKLAK